MAISFCAIAQPQGGSSDCLDADLGCNGDWYYTHMVINIPEFPSCPITITYRDKPCGPNTYHYQLYKIDWQVPDLSNPNDPSNPCYELHNAYLESASGVGSMNRDQFLQSLFHAALRKYARMSFDQKLVLAQNDLAQDPNNPVRQANYQSFLCPNGQKIFRATYATCMSAVHGEFPLQGGYKTDTANTKGSVSLSTTDPNDPNDVAQPLQVQIKYYACNAEAVCCLREFRICYNEATQFTRIYSTTTPPSDLSLCPIDPPDVDVIRQSNPGFQVGRCLPYCDAGEYTPPMIEIEDPANPDISKK
ncbi:MAG: hypothetical protein IT211_06980 [Armatimonadetes bacterium]|nr:hypothetical protein [Armatimonadota bacterium]